MHINIKKERFESRLKEVIAEAISSMQDSTINTLAVVDVSVSKGKYDADIFIEGSDFSQEEKSKILNQLKKANRYISRFILASEDWFKVPKLHFKFDESLKSAKRLDELFEMIKSKS
jgi:ribosome-binding factor A